MSYPSTSLAPPQELRWLYIDFNSYFASVEQQLDPRLRGKPVIVIPVETEATSAIAASYEAKAFGIKTGTPVYEARRLCPDVICVSGRHDHYVEFHNRIIDEIDNHIPVSQVCSIDEMACQLMNNERTPQRIAEIAASIKRGLAKNIGEYVRCSIGVAPSKYLAKVATDLKKPDGFTILQPSDLPDRLLSLKMRDLPGIGHNIEKRINRAGVYDMAGLYRLAPRQMRAIWGSLWGEKMWYYLRGHDLADEKTSRRSVGHSHVLAPALRPPAEAYQVARRLVMKVAARLRRMKYHASAFAVSVRTEKGARAGFETRCDAAQDSPGFLLLLEELWREIIRETGTARIKKVSVTLNGLVEEKDVGRQPDLFAALATPADTRSRQRHDGISQAMDKLNQKFGKDTVLLGMPGTKVGRFTGTKIAFTRIPDMEEFLE